MEQVGRKTALKYIFHIAGLSAIGGAIFLQIIVFASILQQGIFIGSESNIIILASEVALATFSVFYYANLIIKKARDA